MREIRLRRVVDAETAKGLIGDDVGNVEPTVDDEALIVDDETGEPVLLFIRLPLAERELAAYRQAVRAVPMSDNRRAQTGVRNLARTFGMVKRSIVVKRESCRASTLSRDAPEAHATLLYVATKLAVQLEGVLPEVVRADREAVSEVLPEWRMYPGSTWTSGIVNQSSALPYHRDRANYPTWSAMSWLRRGVRGGHLHCPEYDLCLGCRDGFAVYFNGAGLVHGVTPIEKTTPDAYRYSVVHYSIRGMRDCASEAVEQARSKRKRTERERADRTDLSK